LSYLKAHGSERLTLPSDPEFWVEMKLKGTYGDKLAAQQAIMKGVDIVAVANAVESGNGTGAVTEVESAAFFQVVLLRLITAWNLTDLDGQELPITGETIGLLDDEDGEFLQREARKRLAGRPKAAAVPLGKRSQPS
jgi:hypothetical protein